MPPHLKNDQTTANSPLIFALLVLFNLATVGSTTSAVCDSPIYCDSDLLHVVQMSHIYPDSKTFVDMPTRLPLDQVLANFRAIANISNRDEVAKFVADNFYAAGKDTITVTPTDWQSSPAYLSKIADAELNKFAVEINSRWRDLMRKFDPTQICPQCKTSAIVTNNPFMVPGGRFIEYYYWDSYWIVKSLLVSGMTHTAKNMIQNFLDIVAQNGFVPNGARIYYLNRSQPPLLAHMIDQYMEYTSDVMFLTAAIDLIDAEHSFWMTQKSSTVTAKDGRSYQLNKYDVRNTGPRPESYREDYENARNSPNKTAYYMSVATAAESGWDFSSRWFVDPMDIKTITINDIIPVDLNAILYRNELLLNKFYTMLNNKPKADFYAAAMNAREQAINAVLWNDSRSSWGDYNIKTGVVHNDHLYITDLAPLWSGVKPPQGVSVDTILERYKGLLMSHRSGIPASSIATGQQWDFPNVWAPYHDWIVEYLVEANRSDTGFDIAQRFVRSVHCGWRKTTYIYEKYNADKVGEYGAGGEYVVQEGFGWTNGVVVIFMNLFGDRLTAAPSDECNFSSSIYNFSYLSGSLFLSVYMFFYSNLAW